MSVKRTLFQKLNMVSWICTIFVVYIHADNTSKYELCGMLGKAVYVFEAIICDSLISVAVPVFYLISGFLFFRNYTLKRTREKYNSRFYSIFIPYILWNSIYTMIAFFFSVTPLRNIMGEAWVMNPVSLHNICLGIIKYKYLSVFWYMYYLILLIIVSPVVWVLIKNKYMGAISLITYLVLLCFKMPYTYTGFFTYLLGGYMSINHYYYTEKLLVKGNNIGGLGLIGGGMLIRVMFKAGSMYINPVLDVVAIIMIFVGLCYLLGDSYKNKSMYGDVRFFIYAMHLFVLAMIKKMIIWICPDSPISALISYLIVPPITIAIILMIVCIVKRVAPEIYKSLVGKRVTEL